MNPVTYIKDTLAELKQVSWPTPVAVTRLTITVIAISAIVAVYIGGLDLFFTNALTYLFK